MEKKVPDSMDTQFYKIYQAVPTHKMLSSAMNDLMDVTCLLRVMVDPSYSGSHREMTRDHAHRLFTTHMEAALNVLDMELRNDSWKTNFGTRRALLAATLAVNRKGEAAPVAPTAAAAPAAAPVLHLLSCAEALSLLPADDISSRPIIPKEVLTSAFNALTNIYNRAKDLPERRWDVWCLEVPYHAFQLYNALPYEMGKLLAYFPEDYCLLNNLPRNEAEVRMEASARFNARSELNVSDIESSDDESAPGVAALVQDFRSPWWNSSDEEDDEEDTSNKRKHQDDEESKEPPAKRPLI